MFLTIYYFGEKAMHVVRKKLKFERICFTFNRGYIRTKVQFNMLQLDYYLSACRHGYTKNVSKVEFTHG